jgi:gliding motility-associated-like protein
LVTNGNFSAGNTGFTSGYVNNSNLVPEGRYFITTNANLNHNSFVGVDHTTGTGNFMAVNGSGTPNTDVWCQTVAVTPNTLYAFSTWVSTLAPGSPARLQFSINGVALAVPFNAPSTTNNWIQFFQTWNSGNATTATICIVNQNTNTGGNDFGLDDISFSPTCSATAQVTVTIGGGNIFAGTDQNICPGGSAQLNATGGQNYAWSPALGLSATNIANPVATPSTTTNYIVTGQDNLGCNARDTVQVIVNQNPNVDAGQNQAICPGSTAQLTATGGNTYVWTPAATLSNPAIVNPIATPLVSTTYFVTGTSQAGCSATDSVRITVNPAPNAVATGTANICPGQTAQLNASGGQAYLWSPATGLTNPNIANPVASPSQTTTYSVVVFNLQNCSDTATVSITVLQAPTVNAGNNTGFCAGGSVQLAATGAQTYSWSPSSGLSNPNIANPVANPTQTTTYIVTGTSQNGCTNRDTVLVEVWPNPTANAGPNQNICSGSFVQLLGSGGQTYQWTPSATLNNDTIFNPTGTPNATTTYTLTVGNQFGCTNQAQVTITILPTPFFTVSNDTLICPGTSAQLNAFAVGATSYTWHPITGLNNAFISNPISTPPFTVFYTVSIQTATCTINDSVTVVVNQPDFANAGTDQAYCLGGSANLSASGGVAYQWFPSSFLSSTNTANTTTASDTSIIYGVIVTNQIGCRDTDFVNIVVNPLPVVDAGPSQANVCSNATYQLNATGANTYVWTPGAGLSNPNIANPVAGPISGNQNYTVTGTDQLGCQNTDVIQLILALNPTANAGPDTTICLGGSITLNASGGVAYLWTPPTGLSSINIANPIAFPTTSTPYIVTVTDANGCSGKDTVVVSVFSLTIAGDTTVCQGDTFQIQLPPGATYTWNPTTGVSDTNSANPLIFPNQTTVYSITAVGNSSSGCVSKGEYTVNILPGAVANFVVKYMPGCDSLVAKTFNNSQNASRYKWSWGNAADTASVFNPLIFLPYGIGRKIQLIAIADNGCNDTLNIDSSSVTFDDSLMALVPNVFSPNADGTNDCFKPEVDGWFANCFTLTVYNRWGELIFESFREGHCWDGRTKGGNLAQIGTYYYVAKVRDLQFKGYVQLTR